MRGRQIAALVKGGAIAVALMGIGVPEFSGGWWAALIALSVAVNL
ncbi:hypothetical protein [Zhongshania sp.]